MGRVQKVLHTAQNGAVSGVGAPLVADWRTPLRPLMPKRTSAWNVPCRCITRGSPTGGLAPELQPDGRTWRETLGRNPSVGPLGMSQFGT